ncbi:tetraspanin-2 [Lolium perenne]|uniref:tetraspanin-2 n=1 Tax=Lolium perenne TaxID=4522 RepID=UPI0021EB3B05|nr:tetraspanin-2-like isoform X2 [Lolium perenne]
MAVSNNITACVTLMALICAVPVIASGIWFASAQGEECARLARWPVAILGGLILLAALAGFVGAYWNRRRLLAFYLFAMGLLIVLLIALLAFAFAVTRGSGAYPVLGRAYDEYRLDGFSMWLRGYVSDDPGRWEGIKSCLAVSDTCKKLARQASFVTADQFYQSSLTPLQSGCCKPPSVCGFGYVSPTVWTNPARPAADADCGRWSNDPAQLCYECESCRAGLLATLRRQWHKANIALVVATVSLVFLYLVGCSAYKNAHAAAIYRRYKW